VIITTCSLQKFLQIIPSVVLVDLGLKVLLIQKQSLLYSTSVTSPKAHNNGVSVSRMEKCFFGNV